MIELVEKQRYKELKCIDDQKSVLADYKCLMGIKQFVNNNKNDQGMNKKIVAVLNKLILEQDQELLGSMENQKKEKNTMISEKLSPKKGLSKEISELQSAQKTLKDSKEFAKGPLDNEQNLGYKENVFSKEDFLLYRGIVQFYLGNYKSAINDFETSTSLKAELKTLTNMNDEAQQDMDQIYNQNEESEKQQKQDTSINTDLSDVGLCAVNINEHYFNLILCYLLVFFSVLCKNKKMGNHKLALEKANVLIDNLPQKYSTGAWLLRGLINEVLGHKKDCERDFGNARKYDEQAVKFLDKNESIKLNIFPTMNRLCTQFPYIDINLPKHPPLVFSIFYCKI